MHIPLSSGLRVPNQSSKILLKVVTRRILNRIKDEIVEEQAGLKAVRGKRNPIVNLKFVVERTVNTKRPIALFY